VIGERASTALPATHANLRPRLLGLGELVGNLGQFTLTNLPVVLVLLIACTTVGTLVYARTATREGEIALRSALGASRGRIIGQLFVEALVLAAVAATVGLVAADRALRWGIEAAMGDVGEVPFWMTPGLALRTVIYASGLAVASAAMLSILPALRATRARVQSNLANLGNGGATLRFGRVWTSAMITQVALTAIGIPVAMEGANQVMRKLNVRPGFPSREHLTARIDFDRPFEATDDTDAPSSAPEGQRALTLATLEQRLAKEPGVVAVAFADRSPASRGQDRFAEVEAVPGAEPIKGRFLTSAVGPGFFETLTCPIVAGRPFHGGDWNPGAHAVIVNEEFARRFARDTGRGSPVGMRLRYAASPERPETIVEEAFGVADPWTGTWFEIVGVVRNFGLNPDDSGNEAPFVFHAGSVDTMSSVVMTVRVRGNPGPLAARLPGIAARIDTGLSVRHSQGLDAEVRERNNSLAMQAAAGAAVTALILFLSAMGIFSLVSVSVSRRTREIGLRAALGAHPRHVLAEVLSRAVALMGSGIAAGGVLLMLGLALHAGPTTPAEDIPLFTVYLAITAAVMLAACLLACIGPATRALRINPTEALREA
jgi:hypothetical protein